jgi:hypothetical protein
MSSAANVVSRWPDYGIALRESLVDYSCFGLLKGRESLSIMRSSEIGQRKSIDSFCDLQAQLRCLKRESKVYKSSNK